MSLIHSRVTAQPLSQLAHNALAYFKKDNFIYFIDINFPGLNFPKENEILITVYPIKIRG